MLEDCLQIVVRDLCGICFKSEPGLPICMHIAYAWHERKLCMQNSDSLMPTGDHLIEVCDLADIERKNAEVPLKLAQGAVHPHIHTFSPFARLLHGLHTHTTGLTSFASRVCGP